MRPGPMSSTLVRAFGAGVLLLLATFGLYWMGAVSSVQWVTCLDTWSRQWPPPPSPFDARVLDYMAGEFAQYPAMVLRFYGLPFLAPALAFAVSRTPGRQRGALILLACVFLAAALAQLPYGGGTRRCESDGNLAVFWLAALPLPSMILTLLVLAANRPRRSALPPN